MGLVSAEGLQAAKALKVARQPMTRHADEAFQVIYSTPGCSIIFSGAEKANTSFWGVEFTLMAGKM